MILIDAWDLHDGQRFMLIAFWATPVMTVAHALFAVGTTGYILVAIQLEERDLVAHFGDTYRRYRASVLMLLPFRRGPK
jgi:protein-S-isoprenylcysteine O-methyltransferase Ste14